MDDRIFTITGNEEIQDQIRRQNGRHKVLKGRFGVEIILHAASRGTISIDKVLYALIDADVVDSLKNIDEVTYSRSPQRTSSTRIDIQIYSFEQ